MGDHASSMASNANLLNDAKFISRYFSQSCYSYTKREGNKVTHGLAQHAVNVSNFFSVDGGRFITVFFYNAGWYNQFTLGFIWEFIKEWNGMEWIVFK